MGRIHKLLGVLIIIVLGAIMAMVISSGNSISGFCGGTFLFGFIIGGILVVI